MEPTAIVLHGTTSSGKSSLAKALQVTAPVPAFHITLFEACLQVLRIRPTCIVSVWAPLQVLETREQAREDRAPGMAREQVGHSAYARRYDLVVDTSKYTPEEGAAATRRFIREQK